jgi:hypothetical protein
MRSSALARSLLKRCRVRPVTVAHLLPCWLPPPNARCNHASVQPKAVGAHPFGHPETPLPLRSQKRWESAVFPAVLEGVRGPKIEGIRKPGIGPLRSHRISDSLGTAYTDVYTFEGLAIWGLRPPSFAGAHTREGSPTSSKASSTLCLPCRISSAGVELPSRRTCAARPAHRLAGSASRQGLPG